MLITAGFYVLPKHAVDIPSLMAINIHPGDLPRYAGGYAFQAQLLRGETHFKVSAGFRP